MKSKCFTFAMAVALSVSATSYAAVVDGVGDGSISNASASTGVTPRQQQRLALKLQHIQTIMSSVERHSSWASVTPESRQWLRESLYKMSLEAVQQMGVPVSFAQASEAMSRARVTPKVLGDVNADLVYTPFPPCRYIDTRNVGGKINGVRGFDIANAGDIYGGSASCNILTLGGGTQANTRAIAMNLFILDTSTAASPGTSTVRPAGATATTALVNWTVSSAGFQLGNAAVVTSDLQPAVPEEFEIVTSGPVHAVVDVFGVFLPPEATALDCTVVQAGGSGTVLNNNVGSAPARPACPAGYFATSVACMYSGTPPAGVSLIQVGPLEPTGSGWTGCRWFNASGGSIPGSDLNIAVNCCRSAGR